MRVRAKENGYYDNKERVKGEVFTLTPKIKHHKDASGITKKEPIGVDKQFSDVWMEVVKDGAARPAPKRFQDAAAPADVPTEEVVEETEEQDVEAPDEADAGDLDDSGDHGDAEAEVENDIVEAQSTKKGKGKGKKNKNVI